MHGVYVAGDRIGHLLGSGIYADMAINRAQNGHELAVEVRHRTRIQCHVPSRTVACLQYESMVDKVERQLKRAVAVGDRRSCKPSRRNVERRVPPVVYPGGEGQPDLTD